MSPFRSEPQGRPVGDWKPARKFPESYPGECPRGSYLLLDDRVLPLDLRGGRWRVGDETLDELLRARSLPRLGERVPVLAYGANRNPATLAIKLDNYAYRSAGDGLAVPMLAATLADADVVASGLHGQGYFYGDLLHDCAETRGTRIECWVSFLDRDQLRVMHESEQVAEGLYAVARFDGLELAGVGLPLSALGYASHQPPLTSPRLGSPIAYGGVAATGRRLPAMTARELMEHFFAAAELWPGVGALIDSAASEPRAQQLSSYLNRQWWQRFEGRGEGSADFHRLLERAQEAVRRLAVLDSSAERLARRGALLGADLDAAWAARPRLLGGLVDGEHLAPGRPEGTAD